MRVLLICILSTLLLLHSEAFIAINIDPEDLDQVSDFFQSVIVQTSAPMPTNRRVIIPLIKKMTYSTIQLLGVMMTLVGANILSSFLTPDVAMSRQQQQQQSEIIFRNFSNNIEPKYAEMCKIDFGCNKNRCWKSCNTVVGGKNLWCYASPEYHARNLQHCEVVSDCSLCWDCIEPCHA